MNRENRRTDCSLIGPHDGRELKLMLAGEKPLAMFFAPLSELHVIPDDAFAPHVREGTVVRVEKTIRRRIAKGNMPAIRLVLFALPDELWRIDAVLEIVEPVWSGLRRLCTEDDIEIGRLLGYSEEAIKHFTGFQGAFEGGTGDD